MSKKKQHYLVSDYEEIIENLSLDDLQKKVFRVTWLQYLIMLNSKAGEGWAKNNAVQIFAIGFSLIIPVVEASKLNYNIFNLNLSVVSILGLLVAIATTLNRQLAFEDKWRHFRRTAEVVRNEGDDFIALAGNYEKYVTHRDAFRQFITTLTTFKRNEANSYTEQQNGTAGAQS